MAQKDNKAVDKQPANVRNRRVRWRPFKLLAWVASITFVLSLLLAGVAYMIYRNPTEAVNLLFEELIVGQEVKVGKISFPKPGLMRVDGLKARDPDGGGHWLDVEEVDIEYSLEELQKHRHIKSLRLKRPVIRIDEAVAAGLGKTGVSVGKKKTTPNKSGEMDLSFLAKITDDILVEEGQVELDWPGVPKVKFSFDADLRGLHTNQERAEVWISDKPLQMSLRDVRVGPENTQVFVKGVELEARVSHNGKKIEVANLEIIDPEVAITPQWLVGFNRKASSQALGVEVTRSASVAKGSNQKAKVDEFYITLAKIGITRGQFGLSGFDGEGGGKLLPKVAFAASVDWENIVISGRSVQAGKRLSLTLEDVSIDGAMKLEGAPVLLGAKELEVSFSPQELLQGRRLETLVIRQPAVNLSAKNLVRLMGGDKKTVSHSSGGGASKPQKSEKLNEGSPVAEGFRVVAASIEGGRLVIEEMEANAWPDVEAEFSGEFRELVFGGAGPVATSPELQLLRLSGVKINGGQLGGDDLLLAAPSADVDFKIDEVLQDGMVDRLEIRSPKLLVNDDTLSRWLESGGSGKINSSDPQSEQEKGVLQGAESGAGDEIIWKVRDLKVTEGFLATHIKNSLQGFPWLQGNFNIKTMPFEFSADKRLMQEPRYRLSFSGVRVRPQAFVSSKSDEAEEVETDERGEMSQRDVVFVRDLTLEVTPTGLQKEKRIDSVVISEGEVKLDDGFEDLIGAKKGVQKKGTSKLPGKPKLEVPEAKTQEAPSKSGVKGSAESGWKIGELGVNRTVVRLGVMVPQLEGVQFAVETSMHDVPLTADGLISRDHIQQVELAGIELRDPYDGMRVAAILPAIFLKFSLGGLMRQEVESVDIHGSVLYVGEPLFNWIDYQRKYRQQNEGTSLGPEEWEGQEDEKNDATTDDGSWKLNHINAHHGKMVIAPIGTPIGVVPFPFSVETHLEDGQIALNLEIPQEQYVYKFADLKLNLYGLSGKVEFNVPIKQKSNNLVQTFELDRLVWKQFNAEKISVEVTYDVDGIYGKLGGYAYGGYVNGAFNIYLKDLGKWDGWLAATHVHMEPITRVLAPENFVMDGTISGKLVSNGKGLELGTTTGELQSVTPGRIEITKLEELLAALPEEWTQLKRSLTELALNGLKAFDYDKAQGRIDMINRHGKINLDLRGPTGSRVFNLHLHDWREGKEKAEKDEALSFNP